MTVKFFEKYGREFQAFILSKIFTKTNFDKHVHFISREGDLIQFAEMIRFFNKHIEVLVYPSWDCLPYSNVSPGRDVVSKRYKALKSVFKKTGKQKIFLLSADSALQKIISPSDMLQKSFSLVKGQDLDFSNFITNLEEFGYARQATVYSLGEYSIRGGILDIFVSEKKYPIRLDFFGHKLESIRTFDPSTQLTNGKLETVTIFPVREICLNETLISTFRQNYRKTIGTVKTDDRIYNSISENILVEGTEHWLPLFHNNLQPVIQHLHGSSFSYDNGFTHSIENKWDQIVEGRNFDLKNLSKSKLALLDPSEMYVSPIDFKKIFNNTDLKVIDLNSFNDFNDHYIPPKDFAIERNKTDTFLFSEIVKYIKARHKKHSIILSGQSQGSVERLLNTFREYGLVFDKKFSNFEEITASSKQLLYSVSQLDDGFSWKNFEIITEKAIFGENLKNKRDRKFSKPTAVFEDLNSINIGDFVVHIDYGIGQFVGLKNIQIDEIKNDFLEIQYFGSDKIFLPVENIDLISPLGLADAKLDKLGSANWQARKANVKKRIKIIAEKLIKVAAKRKLVNSEKISIQKDIWQEFSDRFPYQETPDQLQAIDDVISDFSKGNPMDRLICGDVGFGKTEVAIRASFALVTQGKQVVLATPTTLLAKQHEETFKKRFDGYPIEIRMLSRLTKNHSAREIKIGVGKGDIDILIGTHSVINKKLEFYNLGLAIIDEEQSFGVDQKEQLKSKFPDLHILTLSATPIPRTLQMAFTGIRDLSLINTPPKNRMPIETSVLDFDEGTLRSAILRETNRNGQVFFVVPRIKDIKSIESFLSERIPNINYRVATGKTKNRDLEKTIADFYYGDFDLLVSTNIIGSGIDIPRANTIIIYKAELFGLGQLYQIRGRVGRSNKRAFAYLVTNDIESLTDVAKKRLYLIKELSSLVSGFTLSTQDLEMRGSGNILGEEQTGQMNEVGVSLYQDMLEKTIASLQLDKSTGEKALLEENWSPTIRIPMTARIPESYINDSALRLSFYRRLSSSNASIEIEALLSELIDRFGELPGDIKNLVNVIKIRDMCKSLQIETFEVGNKGITIKFREGKLKNIAGFLAFIESDRESIVPNNEKLFIKTKEKNTLKLSYKILKNLEIYLKKNAPSEEDASY
ncbi:transcription-repair coupling factor [Paracoccaceae bacterium]|nr:transcription-repair coupling factor [Paracoccaceae bacterium]